MKPASEEYAIEIDNLSKSFRQNSTDKRVLKGISLKIAKNQIFGLLGPNGAGKTTLIYILSGLLHAEGGSAKVLGFDPKTQRGKLAKRINICSGNAMFLYHFTPREVLMYYGLLYGMNGKDIEANSSRLIRELGITEFADRQFNELSTGMRQKVALAKSLINDPELVFLDEPTLGLDVEIARRIRKYIKELVRKKKTTIVLTSHYLSEVEELCDDIAIINHGKIIVQGTAEQIKELGKVESTIIATCKIPRKDITFLKKIPGVRHVDVYGNEITVYTDGGPEPVEKVVASFREEKIALSDIEVRKPTLEEAFLRLVNKEEEE